jgi:hypothetical protein
MVIMILNAVNAIKGIVIKPKYSIYLVVQETPVEQGAKVSGIHL